MFTRLIESIHASPHAFGIIATGAGGSAIADLMSVPGCSKTLIQAVVPYDSAATTRMLDYPPSEFVSARVSRHLAQHAFADSLKLRIPQETSVVGIGLSANIKSPGYLSPNRVWISSWREDGAVDYFAKLPSDITRVEQEQQVASLLLHVMAECCGLLPDASSRNLRAEKFCHAFQKTPLQAFYSGDIDHVVFNANGEARANLPPFATEEDVDDGRIRLLYPGSFNPLHWGHLELARTASLAAQERLGASSVTFTYEISTDCVGKGRIDEDELSRRLAQFLSSGKRCAVTRSKLFVDKAKQHPRHGFVVGIDTARRILDPRYYDNSVDKMMEALNHIKELGCWFVVGGRQRSDGKWEDACDLAVHDSLREMFILLPEEQFRADISSTFLREQRTSLHAGY